MITREDKIPERGEPLKDDLIYAAARSCRAGVFANRSQTIGGEVCHCGRRKPNVLIVSQNIC